MKNLKTHKDFHLNGKTFSSLKELLEYSKTFSSSIHSFLIDWFNDDAFIVVETSGSTGKPKTIQLKKEHMINSAQATGEYFELKEQTTVLLCLSVDYIAGKMMLVRAIVLGWYIDVVEISSKPLNGITKTYDFTAMTPMQLNNSIIYLHKIKKLIVGGGAVSQELQNNIQNVSTLVYATYGMTETCTHIAVKQLNNFCKNVIASEAKQSVHKCEITSVENQSRNDENYQVLSNIKISKDNRECLVINAPNILDTQIITNDIVEIISKTKFRWLGRYDSIINSGGIKLIPEQIEEKISMVIDNQFFVTGIVDEILGTKLVLIVENKKPINFILNKVKNLSSLNKFEVPKKVYFIKKFVYTETNKINRMKTLKKLGLDTNC